MFLLFLFALKFQDYEALETMSGLIDVLGVGKGDGAVFSFFFLPSGHKVSDIPYALFTHK